MNPLQALSEHGQSVWLDFLSRDFLANGGLERLVREDAVSGVTANPSIFEKAIVESRAYDADIERAIADDDPPVSPIYERLAIADIHRAADILRPVYDANSGRDGFVSLEVSPYIAMDTAATITEARRLWQAVGRDNLMIKVPGTEAGIPAIRALIGEGINVNITLLFSQQIYEQVIEAYLGGLERLAAAGRPLDRMASVASFFVSRIDTAVDQAIAERLEQTKDPTARAALAGLRGKVAIANAKLAYRRYLRRFAGPRWEKLAQRGARTQRLLWASTGTKSPEYRDVLYVEELIGPDTVNTMPPKTMDAFRDHGRVRDRLIEDVDRAEATLANLGRAGISLDAITARLVADGVRLFADAFDQLLGALAAKRRRNLGPKLDDQAILHGDEPDRELGEAQEVWRVEGKVRRLWGKDAKLWTGHDESNWLDWLDIVDDGLGRLDPLTSFAREIRAENFRDVVLLGMGGSSLGPEVLAQSLGSAADANARALKAAGAGNTLKSWLSAHFARIRAGDYFWSRVVALVGERQAGKHFAAVTDPGSRLQKVAEQKGFRRIFPGVPGIGGRYSVLSNFGMVPLAASGHDVRVFLERARAMGRACGGDVPPAENPGVRLGLALGVLARRGRDKVTIVASPSIGDFGAWAEQLLAESTGKNGKGLIPIDAEPLGEPAVYGSDRVFVYLRDPHKPDAAQDRAMQALQEAGQPLVHLSMQDAELLGQEFFRWEIATAVVGAVIGINPFDQPDVEASKVATRALTEAYEKAGSLPAESAIFKDNGIALFTDDANARALKAAGAGNTLKSWLSAHFARIRAGDYFAVLAYIERNDAHLESLQRLRTAIRDRKHIATCVEFGPRFLHSTGQAYKGGPNTGVFLQVTCEDALDLEIPGRKATFGVVKAAQARGDFRVLAERGRRVLRAHIVEDVSAGLAALDAAAEHALS
ncbi:MAG: bifunctional transaldolase/phosoglucose isomerase [Alphaproteobacteria bacterium]|nr:MAG: bifunctional transaldolase/phosoglucose isomerase [Alphaproteobacteria bacterium]